MPQGCRAVSASWDAISRFEVASALHAETSAGDRRAMSVRLVACALVLGVLGGCVTSAAVECGGYTCPAGGVCDTVHGGCVTQEQVDKCEAQPDFMSCSYLGVDLGSCYDGICLPGGCGNGRDDPMEACDDGNQNGGDGCSAD